MSDVQALVVRLDAPLPARLAVGKGQVLYLSGRCYHPVRDLRALEITIDGVPYGVPNHSSVRSDVPSDDPSVGDVVPNSLTSGFWAAVPLVKVDAARTVSVAARAVLDDGSVRTADIGAVRVEPDAAARSSFAWRGPEGRVAICLGFSGPEPACLAEQLAAILAQGYDNWCCVVSDDGSAPEHARLMDERCARDARFLVVRQATCVGRPADGARALAAVPADADVVVLAGDASVWRPDTLARLLAAFAPDTTVVCGGGALAAEHAAKRPHAAEPRTSGDALARALLAESDVGLPIAFRAALLADVLPMPPRVGDAWWIVCVALLAGDLRSVDLGLAASRPHLTPTVGRARHATDRVFPTLAGVHGTLGAPDPARRFMAELWRRRDASARDVVRLVVTAKVLRLRAGSSVVPAKRRVLERMAALEAKPFGLLRDLLAADAGGRHAAWHLVRGVAAARLLDVHYRRQRARLFEERLARRDVTGTIAVTGATTNVDLIAQKLAPLRLRVDPAAPRRVNLVAPAIDFAHLFAGYLGKLHLALRLADAGQRVRIVIVDPSDEDPASWRRSIAAYPGLEALFDRVEVASLADRQRVLPVHPGDGFVATTWWTAHLAHGAARELGGRPFVYLIQEYEPMTFPMGSLWALAAESYALPHHALFSTELLRDWFRGERIGVYAGGHAAGDDAALAFENAIARFDVTAERLRRPGRRRALFYARPEQHAARNMFELGVLALRAAVAARVIDPGGWQIDGVGAGRAFAPVALGNGMEMALRPRVTLAEYRALLPGYDVGLALMLTPHPSLVPLEMAAAGLVTVTNTFANKTAAALGALAGNLVPVAPTIDGIATGLRDAVARAADVDARVAGAGVRWSQDWATSFDEPLLARLVRWLGAE